MNSGGRRNTEAASEKEKKVTETLTKGFVFFFYLENVVFIVLLNISTDTTWWMRSLSEGQKIAESERCAFS